MSGGSSQPVVAVSYSADDATAQVNREVLDGHAELVFLRQLPDSERQAALERARVLLTWVLPAELPGDALYKTSQLELLQLLSAGVDHLPFDMVPSSVEIASNVGAYAEPMAEHVMAMTLSLAKRLPQRHHEMAHGRWDQHLLSLSLDGAVCSIVGYGGIGKATARLMRCFGARIWVVNSTGTTDDDVDFVGTLADLDHVLSVADTVVVAIPLTRATRGLIGAHELGLMKPEAILINVARGAVIDQKSLYEHLAAHPDFCAGIDTWWTEPLHDGEFHTDYPFFELPNLIGSPHNSPMVSGMTATAVRMAAENVRSYLEGGPVRGVVRREDYVT
jgi:phosphoglycerate dehydrogenase-like enzyme